MKKINGIFCIVLCLVLLATFCCCHTGGEENGDGTAKIPQDSDASDRTNPENNEQQDGEILSPQDDGQNNEIILPPEEGEILSPDNEIVLPSQEDEQDNGIALPPEQLPDSAEPDLCETSFMRAAWIPTVYGLSFPSAYTTNAQVLKKGLDDIVLKAAEVKLNTLFFQVRPSCDAFYPSEIFPWSQYLTGTQGIAPSNAFDPLGYLIEICHKNFIQLHAWINPFRVTASASSQLIEAHPAYNRPDLTFLSGGKLYLNPGEPNARQLILLGVEELIENYDVDGIHYDDYFYPEGEIHDDAAFSRYAGDFDNINDWRRNNIDILISETFSLVKSLNPSVRFGVSPPGVWANKFNNILGSDTLGFESYYAIFADSRGWVKKQIVDYIAPQIYWERGHALCDFNVVLDWWKKVTENTNVKLIPGLAAYKEGNAAYGAKWDNGGGTELRQQIAITKSCADGFILYSMSDVVKKQFVADSAASSG